MCFALKTSLLGTFFETGYRAFDACLQGKLETVECFTSHANTHIAAAVLHQEGQVRLTDMIGNHNEVPFVLPVSIVEHDHEFARLQVLHSLCGRDNGVMALFLGYEVRILFSGLQYQSMFQLLHASQPGASSSLLIHSTCHDLELSSNDWLLQ